MLVLLWSEWNTLSVSYSCGTANEEGERVTAKSKGT